MQLWAGVHISTEPATSPLFDLVQGGVITVTIDGDDFPSASESQVVYVRITLDQGMRLGDTLVDFYGYDSFNHFHYGVPIALAANIPSAGSREINIAPEAIAIDRALRGETSIWIAIRQPTSDWLVESITGVPEPPSPSSPVTFTIGIDARSSWCANGGGAEYCEPPQASLFPSYANLTANTTDPYSGQPESATATIWCLDTVNASASTHYSVSVDFFEAITDVRLVEFESQIILGSQLPISVLGDTSILEPTNPLPSFTAELVNPPIFIDQKTLLREFEEQGRLIALAEQELQVSLYSDVGLHNKSQFIFYSSRLFFDVALDGLGQPIPHQLNPSLFVLQGSADVPGFEFIGSDLIQYGDQYYSYYGNAYYSGASLPSDTYSINFSFDLHLTTASGSVADPIILQPYFTTHNQIFDEAPFDLQPLNCPSVFVHAGASQSTQIFSGMQPWNVPQPQGQFFVVQPNNSEVSFVPLSAQHNRLLLEINDANGTQMQYQHVGSTPAVLNIDDIFSTAQPPYLLKWRSSNSTPMASRRHASEADLSSANRRSGSTMTSYLTLPNENQTTKLVAHAPTAEPEPIGLTVKTGGGLISTSQWTPNENAVDHVEFSQLAWSPNPLDVTVPYAVEIATNMEHELHSVDPLSGFSTRHTQKDGSDWTDSIVMAYVATISEQPNALLMLLRPHPVQTVQRVRIRLKEATGAVWSAFLPIESELELFTLIDGAQGVGFYRESDSQFFGFDPNPHDFEPADTPFRLEVDSMVAGSNETSPNRFVIQAWSLDGVTQQIVRQPARLHGRIDRQQHQIVRSVADERQEIVLLSSPIDYQSAGTYLICMEDDGDQFRFAVPIKHTISLFIDDAGLWANSTLLAPQACPSNKGIYNDSPATYLLLHNRVDMSMATILTSGALAFDESSQVFPSLLRFDDPPATGDSGVSVISSLPEQPFTVVVRETAGPGTYYEGTTDSFGTAGVIFDHSLKSSEDVRLEIGTANCGGGFKYYNEIDLLTAKSGGDHVATSALSLTRTALISPVTPGVLYFWEDDGHLVSENQTVTVSSSTQRPIRLTAYDPLSGRLAQTEFWIWQDPIWAKTRAQFPLWPMPISVLDLATCIGGGD